MTYSIISKFSWDEWDDLVNNSNQYNLFNTSYFLKLTNSKNCYLIKYKNQIIAGVNVNDENSKDGLNFFYQGLILRKDFQKQKNHKFYKKYHELCNFLIDCLISKYEKFNLSFHYNLNDVRPFDWHEFNTQKKRFKIDIRYTGILDLNKYSDFSHFLNDIRPVRRQEEKKIVEEFSIVEEKDVRNLDVLHNKTFLRQNKKRSKDEIKIVNNIIPELIQNNYGRLITIKLKNNSLPVASSFFLYDKKDAYNLVLATDPNYRKFFFGTKILFNQIQELFKKKFKKLDFVGVNSPNRGDYKLSFNPDLKIYFKVGY